MSTKSTKGGSSISTTTIRISEETKKQLEELDFVRKHTFDEILSELIKDYNQKSKRR